tara:strand:+ start:1957 stop:2409 length:453 start_codon:yes stop_codon:yes gene_type:complete
MNDDNVVNFAQPSTAKETAEWFMGKMQESEYLRMKNVYIKLLDMERLNEGQELPISIHEFLESTFDSVFWDHHEKMYQEVDEELKQIVCNPKNNVERIMLFLDTLSPFYADKDFCGMTMNDILCEISEHDAYRLQLVISGETEIPERQEP